MANANREKTMRENTEKEKKLKELGIPHSALLDEAASNHEHRVQRKEYDRLLGNVPLEECLPKNQNIPSPASTDPPDYPTDPVNDEPQDDLDDDAYWLLHQLLEEEEPLIKIHQPDADSGKHPEPAAPPASPPDEPTQDIGQQTKSALKEAQIAMASSNELVRDLQQQLAASASQDEELAILHEKIEEYRIAKRTWTQEVQKLQKEQAALRMKLTGHRLVDDPEELICLTKREHDGWFVERASQINPKWKWACIGCAAVLLITLVLWGIVSLVSKPPATTTAPSAGSSKTNSSNLDLDFPPIPSLK
jgi:hypothetical protein